MMYPPERSIYPKLKTWECRSCKLQVSAGYEKIFSLLRRHYKNEMKLLSDKSLNIGLNVLDLLLKNTYISGSEE